MRQKCKLLFLLVTVLVYGCSEDPVPRPRGYFRIDLPKQEYVQWMDTGYFAAEVPAYARMVKRRTEEGVNWYDLRYTKQRATVHLTWTRADGRVMDLIEDAHVFKNTHEAKAVKISSERLLRDTSGVFGNLFHVDGDVASPLVFYLTDSTENFLYGSLYFDARPNSDSLAPVTDRIREDLQHFARTLEWE